MRAAIYSRFSTDKQTESSIADQLRVCRERAEKEGWRVVATFEDQGISGAALGNRPGVQEMMTAGLARQFDVLLVMELSRLSRSQADLPKTIDRLAAKGVRVIGVQDGYDSARKGHKLQAGLSGIIGEAFREMVSDKTFAALETRAKGGRPTGGRAYGYTSQNEVVEPEAAIVREVFSRYAAGESQRALAADLNRRGVFSPRGRPWMVSALHAILHNERYIGKLIWNKTAWRKDPDTGRRLPVDRDRAEWIVTDREDLRIVPDTTWNQVRSRDTPAVYGSHQARPRYALSGLLVCGDCGAPMTLCGGAKSKSIGAQRYICNTYRNHGSVEGIGCTNSVGVSRAVAEELLIEPIKEKLLNDRKFLAAVAELKKQEQKISNRKNGNSPANLRERSKHAPIFGDTLPHVATESLVLAQKVSAIESAVAAGALTSRDGQAHVARLRAEAARSSRTVDLPLDEASHLANVERLRAALVGACVDALRDALRRVLGTVRCTPEGNGKGRYLHARFDGGDYPLLDWLVFGDGQPAHCALVAGARSERGINLVRNH